MRRALLLLLAVLATPSCGPSADDDGGARSALERGDAELAAGRIDAARAEYERAKDIGATQSWRIRAETRLVGLRRIELGAVDARAAIDALVEEMASSPSESARQEIDRLVDGSDVREELRAHAATGLEQAAARRATARAAENSVIDEMISGGQFAAAVLVLRELESRRAADDVADVEAFLERIAVESEAAAERCVAALPSDSQQAVAVLEEKLASFAGTPGAARILAERERRVGTGFSRARIVGEDSKDSKQKH